MFIIFEKAANRIGHSIWVKLPCQNFWGHRIKSLISQPEKLQTKRTFLSHISHKKLKNKPLASCTYTLRIIPIFTYKFCRKNASLPHGQISHRSNVSVLLAFRIIQLLFIPNDQCTNEAGSCPLLQYVLMASSYYSLIISIFGSLAVYVLIDKIVLKLHINGAMSSEVQHCGEGLIYQSIDS